MVRLLINQFSNVLYEQSHSSQVNQILAYETVSRLENWYVLCP